ncbi:MAG: hypothetical protein Q3999_04490 [Buchananella hordeovulneris]|nr:hypothetical protein [Buchananella hordeovulneris]
MDGRRAHERRTPPLAGPLALAIVVFAVCAAGVAWIFDAAAAIRLIGAALAALAVGRLLTPRAAWLAARQRPWVDAALLVAAAVSIWVLTHLAAADGVL